MEKYIINGIEVEYDTFDLVNMELYDGEVRRIAKAAESMQSADANNYIEVIRSVCDDILDAFDTILGEGSSEKIFGGKVNAKIIPDAWKSFTRSVAEQMSKIGGEETKETEETEAVYLNREQRRAAERVKRKEEARARVAQRTGNET